MPRTYVKQGSSRFPNSGDDKFDDANRDCELRPPRLSDTNICAPNRVSNGVPLIPTRRASDALPKEQTAAWLAGYALMSAFSNGDAKIWMSRSAAGNVVIGCGHRTTPTAFSTKGQL